MQTKMKMFILTGKRYGLVRGSWLQSSIFLEKFSEILIIRDFGMNRSKMHSSCLVNNAFLFSNFEMTYYSLLCWPLLILTCIQQINFNLMFSLLKQQFEIFWSLLLIKAFL